jgi:nitronate monooxygenase
MAIVTALTRLLGIAQPIILAPMGAVAGGRLAAAVTRAGGLGLLGPGYLGPDWIEREFAAAGNAPVGIGFITWHLARHPEQLESALAHKPPAVMLSFGDPSAFVPAIKASGAKCLAQVQSVSDAILAANAGADVIVAQGSEAGGHGARRGGFALLPAVVDAVAPLPVVAAGGIADGRGLAAALMLGASGVLIGTRFFASEEALGSAAAKQRLVEGRGDETLRTTIFDMVRKIDWPKPYDGRALANDFTRRWHGRETDLAARVEEENARYLAAAEKADTSTAVVWAGEGVDLIQRIEPAEAILQRVAAEAQRLLHGGPGLTVAD